MSATPPADRASSDASARPQDCSPAKGPSPAEGSSPVGNPSAHEDGYFDPQLKTIQPGGGVVMSLELAWGRLRRFMLRTLRPAYCRRMAEVRRGRRNGIPIDPVDARDMKFYRNRDSYHWLPQDDPWRYRDRLPFVRVGLAELVVLGGGCLILAAVMGWFWWPAALPGLAVAGWIAWFFRDPEREIPGPDGTVVSPADGKLVQIDHVIDEQLGKCVQFGIFLSIFNVHANRSSLGGEVVNVRYRPGKFLNALRPESAQENENLDVTLLTSETGDRTPRRIRIRQITGQFARRIVCWVRPGDRLRRGEMFGMIKLGSRTELLIPDEPNLRIEAEIGQKLQAGSSVLARYGVPGRREEPAGCEDTA